MYEVIYKANGVIRSVEIESANVIDAINKTLQTLDCQPFQIEFLEVNHQGFIIKC